MTPKSPRVPVHSPDASTDGPKLRTGVIVWLTNCQGQGRAGKLGSLVLAGVWD